MEDGFKKQSVISRVNGSEGVALLVQKQQSANTVAVSDKVQKAFKELGPTLPAGVEISIVMDNAEFVKQSLDGVRATCRDAVLIVALVLLLFLHTWRSTLIVLISIPTSLDRHLRRHVGHGLLHEHDEHDGALPHHRHPGGRLHRDPGEHLPAHEAGGEPLDGGLQGPGGDRGGGRGHHPGGCGGVHAPRLLDRNDGPVLQGVRRHHRRGHPLLAAGLLHPDSDAGLPLAGGREEERSPWRRCGGDGRRATRPLARGYRRLLGQTLRLRWLVLLAGILAFVGGIALVALGVVGSEFMTQSDQGMFTVTVEMPAGSTLAATNEAVAELEQKMAPCPRSSPSSPSLARAARAAARPGPGRIYVSLNPKAERKRSVFQVSDEIRTDDHHDPRHEGPDLPRRASSAAARRPS